MFLEFLFIVFEEEELEVIEFGYEVGNDLVVVGGFYVIVVIVIFFEELDELGDFVFEICIGLVFVFCCGGWGECEK